MVVGRGAAVVAVEQGHVVGVRADHEDGAEALGERQDAVVLEEDHGLACRLGGQGVMLLAADHVFAEIGPGHHVGRVEHTQLEAAAKGAAQVLVEVGLGDHTLLEGFGQGHHGLAALEVGAVKDGVHGGVEGVGLGLVLAAGEVVVDGVAVREDDGFIAPLVAENVRQEAVIGAAGHVLVAVVGAHDLAHVTVHDEFLERGEVGLEEVALRHVGVVGVAQGLRSAMHGVVLRAGVGLIVFGIVALHAEHGLQAQDAGEVRVLAAGLLAAAPAGIAENVDVRAPEGELRVAGIVGYAHRHVEDVVVGAVPVGAGLVGHLREDVVHLLRVEGGCHADRLGIDGVAVLANAVAGLAPPVVGGDAEPVHGHGLVHHQAHLLFRGEQGDEVLHAVLDLEARVLEGVLVRLLGATGAQQEQYKREG